MIPQATFETPNSAKCNATGLTKGKYVFKLIVKDNLDNAAESSVEVTVNQDSNSAPIANAGADVQVSFYNKVTCWDSLLKNIFWLLELAAVV